MGHVFISYVRESRDEVLAFCKELESHGIKVWIDINEIKPGARWKSVIRQAIREANFFIACFTKEYHERTSSHMNEEIILAIDRLRQMRTDFVWFIPVLLSGSIPSIRIGGGQTLCDLQYADLQNERERDMYRILQWLQTQRSF